MDTHRVVVKPAAVYPLNTESLFKCSFTVSFTPHERYSDWLEARETTLLWLGFLNPPLQTAMVTTAGVSREVVLKFDATSVPLYLNVWIFQRRKWSDATDLEVTQLVTGCQLPLSSSAPVVATVCGVFKAVFDLPPSLPTTAATPSSVVQQRAREMIRDIYDHYATLHSQYMWQFLNKDRYAYVDLPGGHDPLLVYAAAAGKIRYTDAQADALFTRLHQVAARNVQLRRDYGQLTPFEMTAFTVTEMCTILLRTMLYTADNLNGVPIDQWTNPHWFPDCSEAAYDCEDGSAAIMDWLFVLTHAKFHTPSLQALATFVRRYTPFLVTGELYTEPFQTEQHVYVVLLDKAWVNWKLRLGPEPSTPLPAILVESTNYIDGVWTPRMTQEDMEGYRHAELADSIFGGGHADLKRLVHFSIPLTVTLRNRGYGKASVLLTNQHSETRVHQLALGCTTTHALGVPLEDLLSYRPSVIINLIADVSSQDETITRLVETLPSRLESPLSAFPPLPALPLLPSRRFLRYDLATRVYNLRKDSFHTALQDLLHRQKLTAEVVVQSDISLSSSHSLTQIFVVVKA
jgi:hypothetical protein